MTHHERVPGTSLSRADLEQIVETLTATNDSTTVAFPGPASSRQPVHTVYGGAHLFRADTAQKLGALAVRALETYAPDPGALAAALDLEDAQTDAHVATVHARVRAKLQSEPVEDFRIDFEDGYGHRPDVEEDGHSLAAAAGVAAAARQGTLPPFVGIRIKPLSNELFSRALRTLDLFVTALAGEAGEAFPPGLIVTLPKIAAAGQIEAAAEACASLEQRLALPAGTLRLELMVETPQAIVAADGTVPLRGFVAAGGGRVSGVHFGAYDYTALCGITAAWQDVRHPACDFARQMMLVSLSQTGVHLSDSVTTQLPVPRHRAEPGLSLTAEQTRENAVLVHTAWKRHFDNIRHSLRHGFYQSWDLHPGQLPVRYAAVYDFFLTGRHAAAARLRNFVDQATHATLLAGVFDDAATAQGLLNFFARGLACGALTLDEAVDTGLTADELHGRSFLAIVENRRRRR